MTHILIPREPSPALLRPFIGCNTQELHEAWAAMVRIAEVQHARAGSQYPAQIEQSATLAGTPIEQYARMFDAACKALGQVSDCLGINSDIDPGAEPIIAAIEQLRAGSTHPLLDDRWKARMLDGRAIERDEMGLGDHPELPLLDEGMMPRSFFAALGLELAHTSAEDQLDWDVLGAMSDAVNWTDWQPNPPHGDGWKLVSIFDTEDGPVAWWLRELPEAEDGTTTIRILQAEVEKLKARLARAGAAPAAVAPLPAVFEQIAQSWDGCMYDAPGETLDIGADIRAAAKRLLAEHPAAVAPQGDEDDSLLLCASDLQHSAIYDSHSEMQDCARSVADRIKALAARALAAPALEAPAAVDGDQLDSLARQKLGALLNAFGEAQWQAGRGVPCPSIEDAFEAVISAAVALLAAAPQAPAQEAPAAPAPAVPDGWRLVPANPTDAMLGAAQKAWLADPLRRSSTVYAAALATAPQAPAAPVDDLAQLVKQLVRALRKALPGNDLADKALDYLKRQGLQGSPLRATPEAPQTHAGLLAAAAHIQAKAQAHLDERGSYDPDTGAVEMSESNQEHFNTLDELAEELRELADKSAQAACDKPPAGWTCSRAPGHDGPCAAAPAAPAVDAKAHDWRENASYGGEICAECGAAKGSRRGNAPCAWPPEPLDVCTDPYNCARCKAHPNHRKGLEHAGISRPRSAAQAKEGGAPVADAAPLDVCTDPYNCARCKTHPAHRGDMHHAGISRIGGSA
ncbi:hypothetical protein [Delftia deserti]|uniref:Uncharacterized protein n=1 Tax=Delftia deserti TaxID=1651218 RepID=A0ABW5F0R6_9BURK